MLASDLDGTLLLPDGTVGPRTAAALNAARAVHYPVVFVTGRPPRWLPNIAEQTGHFGLIACANGAALYDLATEQVVAAHAIPADLALSVIDQLRTTVPGATFAIELADDGRAWFAHDHYYRPRWPAPEGTPIGVIETLVRSGSVIKLLARAHLDSDHDADSLLAHAEAALAGTVEITHSNADDLLLEISAPGISKASGLAELAQRSGVEQGAVHAVGDMPNDLPMLTWAGHSYAVGNAHPAVLAVVDQVLPPNDQEGVATLLERLM